MGSLVVLALVVAGIAFVVGGSGGGDESAGDALAVELVAASDRGEDAFTEVLDPVAAEGFSTAPPGSAGAAGSAKLRLASTEGTSSGLYGSTGETAPCDVGALAVGLLADDEVAAAWSDLFGIEPEEIEATLARLTPVVLGRDTFVTNTSYKDGKARRFPAILQSGTRVLVDAAGVPRVKCSCGNPLAAPPAEVADVALRGDAWEGFDEGQVTLVDPKTKPAKEIQTVDVESGDPVTVSTGGVQSLDGYLVTDADGVHVVSEDGNTKTTVIHHEVAAAYDDGQGGLVYQELRPYTDYQGRQVNGLSEWELATEAPTDADAGTIWHLPAGARDPVPLLRPDDPSSRWFALLEAGMFDGEAVVFYVDTTYDPTLGETEEYKGDVYVRPIAGGEPRLVQDWAFGWEASISSFDIFEDRMLYQAGYAASQWIVKDAALAEVGGNACRNEQDDYDEGCDGYLGSLGDGNRLIAGLNGADGSDVGSLVITDLASGETIGAVGVDGFPGTGSDGASLEGAVDVEGDRAILSSRSPNGSDGPAARMFDVSGTSPELTGELPAQGTVAFLRAPLVRPVSAAPAPAPEPEPEPDQPADPVLLPDGIGGLKIGMTYADAMAKGLVGPDEEGCELGGPGDRSADLTIAGVEGWGHFSDGELYAVTITEGAVLTPEAQIGMSQQAFTAAAGSDYTAELDSSTEEMFGIWILAFRNLSSGGTVETMIDPSSDVVNSATAPWVPFCE